MTAFLDELENAITTAPLSDAVKQAAAELARASETHRAAQAGVDAIKNEAVAMRAELAGLKEQMPVLTASGAAPDELVKLAARIRELEADIADRRSAAKAALPGHNRSQRRVDLANQGLAAARRTHLAQLLKERRQQAEQALRDAILDALVVQSLVEGRLAGSAAVTRHLPEQRMYQATVRKLTDSLPTQTSPPGKTKTKAA